MKKCSKDDNISVIQSPSPVGYTGLSDLLQCHLLDHCDFVHQANVTLLVRTILFMAKGSFDQLLDQHWLSFGQSDVELSV